jgi:hypothetical protein
MVITIIMLVLLLPRKMQNIDFKFLGGEGAYNESIQYPSSYPDLLVRIGR